MDDPCLEQGSGGFSDVEYMTLSSNLLGDRCKARLCFRELPLHKRRVVHIVHGKIVVRHLQRPCRAQGDLSLQLLYRAACIVAASTDRVNIRARFHCNTRQGLGNDHRSGPCIHGKHDAKRLIVPDVHGSRTVRRPQARHVHGYIIGQMCERLRSIARIACAGKI